MKFQILISSVLLCAASASAQVTSSTNVLPPARIDKDFMLRGGPGIVVSASEQPSALPLAVRNFITSNYPDCTVTSVNHNFVREQYTVQLCDGTRMVFNNRNAITQIVAPKGKAIPLAVLAAILPEKTSVHLAQAGLINLVGEVKHIDSAGHQVMLVNTTPERILYNVDGDFLMFYY